MATNVIKKKRLSKFDIACLIESLPGNTPWGCNSMMTLMCDCLSRQELVDKYNSLVSSRGLSLDLIS